jgi:hypothetical protein
MHIGTTVFAECRSRNNINECYMGKKLWIRVSVWLLALIATHEAKSFARPDQNVCGATIDILHMTHICA